MRFLSVLTAGSLGLAALLTAVFANATTVVGPWIPRFKGIDHSLSTNIPSAGALPHLLVINTLRVDLTDPDIQLFTTPRISGYEPNSRETAGLTVSSFLSTYHLQAAINAGYFDPQQYYLAAGTPMTVDGLSISHGVVVSEQTGPDNSAAVLFDAANHGSIIASNWLPAEISGVYNAVSGTYPVLIGGKDIARSYLSSRDFIHGAQPRTSFGLSEDRRYLYLMTINGRQPGYSEGAYDYETA